MLLWILILLALIAAVIVAVVLFRHWKEIRLLDPDTIKAEQERKVRERIVTQRFDRRLRHAINPIARASRGFAERVSRAYRGAEDRLARAAGMARGLTASMPDEGDVPEGVGSLFAEATTFTREGRFAEAERAYLELLKRDSRNVRAYRGLGALYVRQKLYSQAKETFLFLERIRGCDDACYASLAEIAEIEGNLTDAESLRKRAVDASPRNAGRHADLAAFYMMHGSPEYALGAARRAADLAPEDPRCLEICTEAAILVRDRSEAERRYEQLRLRTDDRHKLQTLRKKIDVMPL